MTILSSKVTFYSMTFTAVPTLKMIGLMIVSLYPNNLKDVSICLSLKITFYFRFKPNGLVLQKWRKLSSRLMGFLKLVFG